MRKDGSWETFREVLSILGSVIKDVLSFVSLLLFIHVEGLGGVLLLLKLAEGGFLGALILVVMFLSGVFLFSKIKEKPLVEIWPLVVPLLLIFFVAPLMLLGNLIFLVQPH